MTSVICKEASIKDDGKAIEITFSHEPISWQFNSRWLLTACRTNGFSRKAEYSMACYPKAARAKSVKLSKGGATLEITWQDGQWQSKFPAVWLAALAPSAAKPNKQLSHDTEIAYWHSDQLDVPAFSWNELMSDSIDPTKTREKIIDILLNDQHPGFVKITDVPPPNIESERKCSNTLITALLLKLFGAVLTHPRRGKDKTFNVSTDQENAPRIKNLDNYDPDAILLPHTDHAHYHHPAMVMGIYGLEGKSINTWYDGFLACKILEEENPDAFERLCKTPICFGRIARYYEPALIQANIDTAVTLAPGSSKKVKRIKWHPHLSGWILTPTEEYEAAIEAHQKFQEILMRPNIQLELPLNPGDLYLWNNFRILHGRKSVLRTPRTMVGQTVPEEIVMDRWRDIKIKQIKGLNDFWLAQLPTPLLDEVIRLENLV